MEAGSHTSVWDDLGISKRAANYIYAAVMAVVAGVALFCRYAAHKEWSAIAYYYGPFLLCVTLFYVEASKKLSPLRPAQAAVILFLILFMIVGFPIVLYFLARWGLLGI